MRDFISIRFSTLSSANSSNSENNTKFSTYFKTSSLGLFVKRTPTSLTSFLESLWSPSMISVCGEFPSASAITLFLPKNNLRNSNANFSEIALSHRQIGLSERLSKEEWKLWTKKNISVPWNPRLCLYPDTVETWNSIYKPPSSFPLIIMRTPR